MQSFTDTSISRQLAGVPEAQALIAIVLDPPKGCQPHGLTICLSTAAPFAESTIAGTSVSYDRWPIARAAILITIYKQFVAERIGIGNSRTKGVI